MQLIEKLIRCLQECEDIAQSKFEDEARYLHKNLLEYAHDGAAGSSMAMVIFRIQECQNLINRLKSEEKKVILRNLHSGEILEVTQKPNGYLFPPVPDILPDGLLVSFFAGEMDNWEEYKEVL